MLLKLLIFLVGVGVGCAAGDFILGGAYLGMLLYFRWFGAWKQ